MVPVESRNSPKASRPWDRRNMSRPATDTLSPVSIPGSSAPYLARSSCSVVVVSNRYGTSGIRAIGLAAGAGVALVDNAKSVEGQPGFVVVDAVGERRDQPGQTAGGDHRRLAQLLLEAGAQPVDLGREAVHGARLHALDGVLADDLARFD